MLEMSVVIVVSAAIFLNDISQLDIRVVDIKYSSSSRSSYWLRSLGPSRTIRVTQRLVGHRSSARGGNCWRDIGPGHSGSEVLIRMSTASS